MTHHNPHVFFKGNPIGEKVYYAIFSQENIQTHDAPKTNLSESYETARAHRTSPIWSLSTGLIKLLQTSCLNIILPPTLTNMYIGFKAISIRVPFQREADLLQLCTVIQSERS